MRPSCFDLITERKTSQHPGTNTDTADGDGEAAADGAKQVLAEPVSNNEWDVGAAEVLGWRAGGIAKW